MTKIDKDKYLPSVEPVNEKVHSALSAGLGLVGASAIFERVFESPYTRRTEEWRELVTEVINTLDMNFEQLKCKVDRNEEILTSFLLADEIAIKTSDKLSWELLKNGLINVLSKENYDEAKLKIFFGTLRELTSLHILVLNFYSGLELYNETKKPKTYPDDVWLTTIIREVRKPEIESILPKILVDLRSNGILDFGPKAPHSSGSNNYSVLRPTKFGSELADFFTEPSLK
ncbi:hypothetical protein DZA50_00835 [Kangiella sp. HD9-110m-PIT-SAG07]|nr:hypothetical protein DZA50_00835 [Kangiella sp. HD9-110m-PIT-SAG07]